MRRQSRLTVLVVLLGTMLLARAETLGQETTTRVPVPSSSDQENAMAMARAVFRSEYTNADTSSAKAALAKKILEQADTAKGNAATHFVLLRLARDVAVQAGDLETATKAIDAMAAVFDVDSAKMKVEVLSSLSSAGPSQAADAPAEGSASSAGPDSGHRVITNSIGMKLVMIPAGEFWMGSTPEQIAWVAEQFRKNRPGWTPNEAPRHRVQIPRPFYMGVYEVTQSEYQQVTYREEQEAAKASGKDTANYPARMVSWEEAVEFCKKLSALPKERSARRVYRLPSEAEFEYASRAGSTTLWCFGDDPSALGEYAWFNKNSSRTMHAVGQKKANPWGLFDTYGNVWEWCSDRFGKYTAQGTRVFNPSYHGQVMRGGSFKMADFVCRSAFRDTPMRADGRDSDIGFRVVCDIGGRGRSGNESRGSAH